MKVWGRSILFIVTFYAYTTILLVVLTPVSLIVSRGWCLAAARAWARHSLWLLKIVCGTTVVVRGIELLPGSPFILAMKHQSMCETLVLLATLRDPAFIMKRELAFVPLWGWLAWRMGAIFVTRGKGSAAVERITRGAATALRHGRTVIIAPEGTRRPPGAPPAYKYGIVRLYSAFDVPIAPMALNSGFYWPRRGIRHWPGTITITFLEPLGPGLPQDVFLENLQTVIETECDQLLLEADRSSPRPQFGPSAEARLAVLTVAEADTESAARTAHRRR